MKRSPQLALRLDAAAPDPDARWRAGAAIDYLGARLTLVLDTACRAPERVDRQLHLPLPPAAAPRQIRDAAESWLRDEALRIFDQVVAAKSALAGRCAPRSVLVFGKRGDWVRVEGELLRCHWRLVEQPLAVIEQVLGQALAAYAAPACDDLFALV
jgi:predicted metal-dependent hydrolase